ncbi:MAG TPA: PLP-dependent aminotransferase family protein [Verrucomicrobiae bacterium]|jgi:2-aminoadipate transaminase|nr:PLP-dependent aminotransferase family protein [Verrucomicrobiae bacterium]
MTMDWSQLFAPRARDMRPSALRQLLKATARPGMISFAGGLPDAELFSLERVQAAVGAVLSRVGGRALQYGETEGVAELRDWIAAHYSRGALHLTRENVLVTTGAQQALDLAGRVLLDAGDRVVVENPTYMAALLAWQPLGANFLPVGVDAGGMKVEELPALLAQRPKMIYVMPTFQNPTGVTLTRKRRVELLQCGAPVFEDNPYEELRYEGERLPSLLELDSGARVFQAGTFSKTLMPGLRIGWVIGPPPLIERMGRAKQAMDLHTSTFNQHLALELLQTGYMEEFIPRLRQVYRERRDAMLDGLAKYFPPGSTWTKPEGGMFIFVTLPEGMAAAKYLPLALERDVAFVPGEEFHLQGAGRNTMRLNFTKMPVAEIKTGVQRLAEVLAGA